MNKQIEGKPVAVDIHEARLQQLETNNAESESGKSYLTQQEYIAHLENQHENLKAAWENGERVLTLKIAIQVF